MSMPNEGETIASMEDAEMQNADAMNENDREREGAMAAKLEELADNMVRVKGSFELDRISTNQLLALQQSELEEIFPAQNLGLTYRRLKCFSMPLTDDEFLYLTCKPSKLYVRCGYEELYDAVCEAWAGKDYRVCLIGNAGTGKSLFQLFVLKQLLHQAERNYDFVVRQVDSRICVIDLKQVAVFEWNTNFNHVISLSRKLKKTLYFFEPGDNAETKPLGVFIPSLSTLSPYETRIKEYSKRKTTRLYFWPWSFSEMWAVVIHSQLSIDFDEFIKRYKLFGGIIRNVLGEDKSAKEKLDSRLEEINFKILTSTALNVDREHSSGNTASGFLVCYNHRWSEGTDGFSRKTLEYTSLVVEDAVVDKLRVRSTDDQMKGVLHCLDGALLDLSGKMLENAAMELLSLGTAYQWQSCVVGGASWVKFNVAQKKIRHTYTIGENYTQPELIIAPTNNNFPVVDFLFSCQNKSLPVVAFRCTWNETHPLTVRALYDFRCEQMQIPDTQIVNIYLVSPDKEALYQSKRKSQFLEGSLAEDLQWTKTKTIRANRLQTMWNSTSIHVLRPERPWKTTLRKWIEGNTPAT